MVGADPRADLAVLHIDRTDLTPLTLGDSDKIQVGDSVVAIGNALDLGAEPTVTGGLISAKDRTITEPNGSVLVDLIQTDAAISPGNSGGPLLDMTGHVVGINTAVAGQGQNIGFAIAINRANDLIKQLRNGEVPQHALLGVTTQPNSNGDPGAVVVSVQAGSAADEAGIQEGDVITGLDGDTVDGPEDLAALIAGHQPGDKVTVKLRARRQGADHRRHARRPRRDQLLIRTTGQFGPTVLGPTSAATATGQRCSVALPHGDDRSQRPHLRRRPPRARRVGDGASPRGGRFHQRPDGDA